MSYNTLEKNIEYIFKNKNLLVEALTHPSKKIENKKIKSYQRLEFLGDKILNFIIAQELFLQFPNENEGEISRRHAHLVCGDVCYKVAQKLDLIPYIIFSKAQKSDVSCNQFKIGEDAIEAIIGAILLDSNLETIQKFISKNWQEYIERNVNPPKDPKSTLQEYFQQHLKKIPEYKITQVGNLFVAKILFNKIEYQATASTKKESEKLVAEKTLQNIHN
ncbi:MAG: ribonuclease-3 [Candidatus Deianiraeaceae bacterium]|jgi:ribonuclease-3